MKRIVANKHLSKTKINQAIDCLVDNGIEDEDEAFYVLQALCYILIDEEIEDYFE